MEEVEEWDSLPNSALVNIFSRTTLKDRIYSTPFVCKSWFQASNHPQCFASMVPQTHFTSSPDHAFLKDSSPYNHSFIDPFHGRHGNSFITGFTALKSLCGKAGFGVYVTSVYVSPFVNSGGNGPKNDDAILGFLAKNCPNLKHLSFHGSNNASEEAVLEVIRNCTKLEIVDFSDSPYFNYAVLKKLSFCCPNLRGIRRSGYFEPGSASALSTFLPDLQLLNLSNSSISDKDLLTLVTEFKGPLYLDIRRCNNLVYYMHLVKVASSSANNIEIIYD